MEFLAAHGFEHYEVSNYAKPGFRSRHNYNYWSHANYLSFGPSAHSFWRENGVARRWFNIANLSHYCSYLSEGKLPLRTEELLDESQLATERIFLGLRSDGLNLKQLREEFPRHGALDSSLLSALVDEGSAVLANDVLRLTARGFLICDEICARLMP
jgi:oxygen-independent coproporphyrinogen III oxidase